MRKLVLYLLVPLVSLVVVGTALGGGTLLWQDRVDFGHRDRAFSVAIEGNRAYVVGHVRTPTTAPDWFVKAYDIRTGTAIWTDRFDRAGSFDFAIDVAVGGGRVFVAGLTAPAAGNEDDFTVRAYDERTGQLLWQDIFDYGGFDEAYSIAVEGNVVVAVGGGVKDVFPQDEDIIVRAYNARTGDVLWTFISNETADGEGEAVAIHKGRVFVAALGGVAGPNPCVASLSPSALSPAGTFRGDCDFLVGALDLDTGTPLWHDQVNIGGDFDAAVEIAADDGRVAAVGVGTPPGSKCQGDAPGAGDNNCDWLVHVNDARTGAFLWGDQFDRDPAPAGFDQANRVAMDNRRIFVTGFTAAPFGKCTHPFTVGGDCDFTVRAYDARTGLIDWEDMFDLARGFDTAGPIAVAGGLLVAAGRAQVNNAPTDIFAGPLMDWLVRAYDARDGALRWQDRFDFNNGHDRVRGVAIRGNRVVAVGHSANQPSGLRAHEDWLVRVYDR